MPKNARDKELARAALKREQEKRIARRNKRLTKAAVYVAVVAVVVLIAVVALGGNKKDKAKPTGSPTTIPSPTPTKADKPKPSTDKPKPTGPPPMTIDVAKTYTAVLDTSFGPIDITLSPKTAPVAVNNFVALANDHRYDGVLFHRVIAGFMIQGGDVTCTAPSPTCGQGDPGYEFDDELTGDEKYQEGTVAMANAGPNTNGSQFFIVTGPDGGQLPPSYTVFGKVADAASLEVAKTIQSQPVNGEAPVTPILINGVKIEVSG